MSVALHNEDCLSRLRLMTTGAVNIFLFSPPYNIGNRKGKFSRKGMWAKAKVQDGYASFADNMPHADYVSWQRDILKECWRLLAPQGVIFYQHKALVRQGRMIDPVSYIPEEVILRQRLIWDRQGGQNMNATIFRQTHEEVLVLAKPGFRLRKGGIADMIRVRPDDVVKLGRGQPKPSGDHPAPFPLEVAEYLIGATPSTMRVVCDPFMGSGTTGVAAAMLGRDFIGIELDPGYAEFAATRISAATSLVEANDNAVGMAAKEAA